MFFRRGVTALVVTYILCFWLQRFLAINLW
jgi:hypothetical protein